ncbi:type I DNA topoisomerase [Entomobacter blattae]|uniref:DNA topoisomerase 1 n=1 Tax=Entomobacter blattae TaxID=2762277 RepID=A0A7H1NUP2_9PROT|nr:type I DNA topoisomerase [Entomobacter blattae]QNT79502.1 DNA topoisomerase 1 [Entomobacter blattae]
MPTKKTTPAKTKSQAATANVVVVESPAKAKTINKYLGGDYTVLASFGHVRDLPPRNGSVDPNNNFSMLWEADERGIKQVNAIAKALKSASTLYLATDPDREGEAISWHVRAMLEEKNHLKEVDVKRVTFNEITKNAIKTAMAHPRDLDQPLIDAYLARRALDYLVGFTLSPVLWRKLPGSRSAGRVQSVALRLICEREAEIESFTPREYWTVTAQLLNRDNAPFSARLTHLNGKKLDQFDLNTEQKATEAKKSIENVSLQVLSVEKKKTHRNPPAPFTTSTLQQEASRKLGMSAQTTMRTAQQLYEGITLGGETTGLITYMRTDGVQMAGEAIEAIRTHIEKEIGKAYLPAKPRLYSSRSKNAQEAHEAIRPTEIKRLPTEIEPFLTAEQFRLYELIWKRALASQMQSAELDQVVVELGDRQNKTTLRANGSTLAFDGYLKLYREGQDDPTESDKDDENSRLLPPLQQGDITKTEDIKTEQHFTQPPPRFSEASLVKKMEEIGIGRPSTYASILTVLRDRNYVRLEQKRFVPEDRGRLVTAFLMAFFKRYVDIQFTANLEEELDDISGSRADWHDVMQAFWTDFSYAIDQTKDLKISDVIDTLDQTLGHHFFPPTADGHDPRQCLACHTGRLGLKLSRHGAFIGCSNYPECQYTRKLAIETNNGEDADTLKEGYQLLGYDPTSNEEITLRRGPYGIYIQKGETDPNDKKKKPKRATLPKGTTAETVTLDQALGLLSLPRIIGPHPETKEPIEAGLGRFGPYVKMGSIFASLDKDEDVLSIGLNRAVDVLAKKLSTIRVLGLHPDDGEQVIARKGRFGPYVQHGKTVANMQRTQALEDVTLEEALVLLNEKGKPLLKKTAQKGRKKATTTAESKNEPKKSKKIQKNDN